MIANKRLYRRNGMLWKGEVVLECCELARLAVTCYNNADSQVAFVRAHSAATKERRIRHARADATQVPNHGQLCNVSSMLISSSYLCTGLSHQRLSRIDGRGVTSTLTS